MRETIKYVDADHKFGKTLIYTGFTEYTSGRAFKDPEATVPFSKEELREAVINGAIFITEWEGKSVVSNFTDYRESENANGRYGVAFTATLPQTGSGDAPEPLYLFSKEYEPQ